MTGKALDWEKICKPHFRAYAQVHKYRNVTNTLEERTQGAIFLGPTGNLQGIYNFFSLRSGNKITRTQFTEVPTSTIFIKRVAAMALAEKQNEGIFFENRTGVTVEDIFPDDQANEAFNKIDRNISGVDWEVEPTEQEIQEPQVHIPHINKNQYVSLAGNEGDDKNGDNQENNTKSTGVENKGEIT